MKKHIIGLTLFSFIVGISAAGFAFFSSFKFQQVALTRPISQIQETPIIQNDLKQPVINQVVFNLKAGTLSWKLNSQNNRYPTYLHWFVETKEGIKKVDSFRIDDLSGEETISSQSDLFKMLKTFPKSNQYVIVDTSSNYLLPHGLHIPFDFDYKRAVSVTVDYGK